MINNTLPPPPIYISFLKHIVLFTFLIFTPVILFSQTDEEDSDEYFNDCGTIVDPDSYKFDEFFGNNQKLVDILLDHGVDIDENYLENLENYGEMTTMSQRGFEQSNMYYIPIKAWVYRNDNGSGNYTIAQIYQMIENVNDLFIANANIKFYLLCDISEINNSAIANNGNDYFSSITLNNKVSGALNVHFVIDDNSPPNEEWGGRAYLPFPTHSRAFTSAIKHGGLAGYSNTLAHEIGHMLGLYHTHQPGRVKNVDSNEDCSNCLQESVSRSRVQESNCLFTGEKKCEVNGDFLCDTEADPKLSNRVTFNCSYYYDGVDNWGDTWTPNTYNLMSYSINPTCRNYLTPLQVAKMYYYISWIGINSPGFSISGPNYLCNGQTANYSVTPLSGVSNYEWTVPNNVTILSGQGSSSITVQASSNYVSGDITVTPNCGSAIAKRTLLLPNHTPINGPDEVCIHHVGTSYSTIAISGITYNWTITNGTILTGQGTNQVTISLSSHSSNQSLIQVTTGMCGGSGGGALYINHIPSGRDCQGEIIPDRSFVLESEKSVLLYPNPAKSLLYITLPDDKVYDIILLNMAGQIVYKKEKIAQDTHSIELNAYKEGIYFVFLNGEKNYSKRLIIKK